MPGPCDKVGTHNAPWLSPVLCLAGADRQTLQASPIHAGQRSMAAHEAAAEASRLQQEVRELQQKLTGLQQRLAAREGAISSLQAAHSEALQRLTHHQVICPSPSLMGIDCA